MKCPYCGKQYKTMTWLRKHMTTHRGVTQCPSCGKIVPDSAGCQHCGAVLDERLKTLKKQEEQRE